MPGAILAIIIVAIVFGCATAWFATWLDYLRKRVSGTEVQELRGRIEALEAELAEQRRLLTDAILEQDDQTWRRLDAAGPRASSVDA